MTRPTPIALSSLLLTFALAMPAFARPGRVAMKDGKIWEGDVTERKKDNKVDIVIEGKTYTFSLDNVARPVEYDDSIVVKPAPTPGQPQPGQPQPGQPQPGVAQPMKGPATPEEFDKRRALVANNDVNGLLALSRWAFEGRLYDQAYDAAKDARDADPRNADAQALLRNIDAQRKLDRKTGTQPGVGRAAPGVGPGATPGPGPGAAPGAAQGGQNPDMPRGNPRGAAQGKGTADNGLVRPLSPDEVNHVRLLEWRGDKGVKVRLMNDVKRRYLSRATITPAEFNKMDAIDQALEIKKKGNPELLNDVRITSDPPPLAEYRTQVQRAVLMNCATAACHGGGAGSDRFGLYPRADHEAEAYANFITLNKYQYKPEKGRAASMIDRNRPEDSLLIQFGLPPAVSNMPHPQADGYKPLFKGTNDPKYREFVKWIANGLSPLIEDYGVPFDEGDRGGDHGKAQPAANAEPPADDAAPADGKAPAGRQQPPARGLDAAPPPGGNAPAPRPGNAR